MINTIDPTVLDILRRRAVSRGYSENESVIFIALLERDYDKHGYEYVYEKFIVRLLG